MTDEFVIHGVENEYDYYYVSHRRKELIETIYKAYNNIEKEPFKFALVNEKSLKDYVTSKKDKKVNSMFTRMKTEHFCTIDEFLSQSFSTAGEVNKNGVVGPQIDSDTVFSSHNNVKEVKLEDFRVLRVIGRNSYGKVSLVEYLPTHEHYAMKSLEKDLLIQEEQIENALLEKEILQNIDYPLLCKLIFCFQTEDRIFFVMPYLAGGELFQHLKKFGTFDEEKVRFYGAQIALALEYLHKKGIIYRDLTPENILMDENGYLKLADFGMAKKLKEDEKTLSFCGTPEYLAPEIITMEGHDKTVDWWSFGILLFEMLYGKSPFYMENINKMYDLIKTSPVKFPKKVNLSEEAKDIIQKLLEKNPKKRLGSKGGIEEIKKHPFFAKIDFNLIEQKKVEAPFIPEVNKDSDGQYYNDEENMDNDISKKNMDLIQKNQDKFKDFSQ